MPTIAEFLTARLDEDERIALATTACPVPGSWRPAQEKNSDDGSPLALIQGREEYDAEDYIGYSWGNPVIVHAADWQHEAEDNLRHIARHDPARVLREVAAKRERLRMYVEQQATLQDVYANPDRYLHDQQIAAAVSAGVLEYAVRQDTTIYAAHPDYDPTWSLDAPH